MPYIQSPIPGGDSLPFDCTKTKSRKSSRFTAHRLFWIFNFYFDFSFAMLAPNKKLSVFVFCNQLPAVAFNRFIQILTLIIQYILRLSMLTDYAFFMLSSISFLYSSVCSVAALWSICFPCRPLAPNSTKRTAHKKR